MGSGMEYPPPEPDMTTPVRARLKMSQNTSGFVTVLQGQVVKLPSGFENSPRIILYDIKGKSYQASLNGNKLSGDIPPGNGLYFIRLIP